MSRSRPVGADGASLRTEPGGSARLSDGTVRELDGRGRMGELGTQSPWERGLTRRHGTPGGGTDGHFDAGDAAAAPELQPILGVGAFARHRRAQWNIPCFQDRVRTSVLAFVPISKSASDGALSDANGSGPPSPGRLPRSGG